MTFETATTTVPIGDLIPSRLGQLGACYSVSVNISYKGVRGNMMWLTRLRVQNAYSGWARRRGYLSFGGVQ